MTGSFPANVCSLSTLSVVNPDTRLSVRFITEVAWQAHFVKNMFIRPSDEELAGFKPDFIVMNGAKCTNPQWKDGSELRKLRGV